MYFFKISNYGYLASLCLLYNISNVKMYFLHSPLHLYAISRFSSVCSEFIYPTTSVTALIALFTSSAPLLSNPPLRREEFYYISGGDPAAPSGTATLLRLLPPHRTHLRLRLPEGKSSLRQTQLGCNDGRCVQGAGTYSSRDR